jgi:cysteine desulfurase
MGIGISMCRIGAVPGRPLQFAVVHGVYFDNNATTPLDPRVREAVVAWLADDFGNPSSAHRAGQRAREAVEAARDRVAALLDADADEIVLTASGTEANNTVVAGALRGAAAGDRVVVSAFEHPSILAACEAWAEPAGVEVVRVAPGSDGCVNADAFAAELGPRTRLAALMLVNNELGTVQPVAAVAARCRELGVPLLCDAVQAAGKIPVTVGELGADYVTIGAHKFHGPLGAAALWIGAGREPAPLLVGGAQERRRRASTVNVPAVVGFGVACELARTELAGRARHLAELRDRFETGLAAIPDVEIHGAGAPRVPHTSNVAFHGTLNQELMMRLDLAGFAVSTGAACGSGVVEPSPALTALGLGREHALGSVRISFGVQNTLEEVEAFLPLLAREVATLRAAAAVAP